jgi:hypothetical protein
LAIGLIRRIPMRSKLAAFSVALFLFTAHSSAQTAPTSHDQAVLDFLEVIGIEKTMRAASNAVVMGLIQVNPPLAPFRDVMVEWANKHITWKAAAPEITKLYKDAFTEAELRDVIAFYRTPTGQKVLLKLPEVMQQGAAIGAKLALAHTPELEQMLTERSKQLQPPAKNPQ